MKSKKDYIVPEIEVIVMEMEGAVMVASDEVDFSEDGHTGPAGSKRRGFWANED